MSIRKGFLIYLETKRRTGLKINSYFYLSEYSKVMKTEEKYKEECRLAEIETTL